MKKISIIVTFLLLSSSWLFAQEGYESKAVKTIFQALATPDSKSGAKVLLIQDERIESIFANRETRPATSSMAGYRVQVFSSNIQRTAKTEAYKIEQEILQAFPQHKVYVTYTAPFWKVRIGDFRTMHEAQALRTEISKQFSDLRNYTYTVRDQINY